MQLSRIHPSFAGNPDPYRQRIITNDLPYDLEEPGDEGEITRGLMRLSQQALSKYVDKEPDIY
jgi:hypothetical protein